MFERAGEIGGTWRDNTYPGAACDVPSHAYSLSFEQYPGWTRRFSPSDEIQAYLLRLVEKWKLRSHLRLGTAIVEARFDEARGAGRSPPAPARRSRRAWSSRRVGGLVDPALPDIKGLESFGGEIFHTARWNHDYELTGKRVAVIGTGASAVQVVPVDRARRWRSSRLPAHARVGRAEDGQASTRSARGAASRASRCCCARAASSSTRTSELLGPMIFLDAPRLSAVGERMSIRHLHAQVKDPALREKLTPALPVRLQAHPGLGRLLGELRARRTSSS